jgi:hypothetical protein
VNQGESRQSFSGCGALLQAIRNTVKKAPTLAVDCGPGSVLGCPGGGSGGGHNAARLEMEQDSLGGGDSLSRRILMVSPSDKYFTKISLPGARPQTKLT